MNNIFCILGEFSRYCFEIAKLSIMSMLCTIQD